MRFAIIGAAALVAASLGVRPAAAAPAVSGEYVEARSCNVFVGACHAEGEREAMGRQAVIAWKVSEGTVDGVRLDGVTAVAVVTSDKNLGAKDGARKSVVYVDATDCAQKSAMVRLLKERAGASLGEIQTVHAAKIDFTSKSDRVEVVASAIFNLGSANIVAKKEPGQLCCIQKYEAWYQPFMTLKESKLGYGVKTGYKDETLKTAWSANEQNNVYFGTFAF